MMTIVYNIFHTVLFCREKPKEQCLSYIKMLHETEPHSNPEDNGEDCEGINILAHQQSVNHDRQ